MGGKTLTGGRETKFLTQPQNCAMIRKIQISGRISGVVLKISKTEKCSEEEY